MVKKVGLLVLFVGLFFVGNVFAAATVKGEATLEQEYAEAVENARMVAIFNVPNLESARMKVYDTSQALILFYEAKAKAESRAARINCAATKKRIYRAEANNDIDADIILDREKYKELC